MIINVNKEDLKFHKLVLKQIKEKGKFNIWKLLNSYPELVNTKPVQKWFKTERRKDIIESITKIVIGIIGVISFLASIYFLIHKPFWLAVLTFFGFLILSMIYSVLED